MPLTLPNKNEKKDSNTIKLVFSNNQKCFLAPTFLIISNIHIKLMYCSIYNVFFLFLSQFIDNTTNCKIKKKE